jgi:hypothetical protein
MERDRAEAFSFLVCLLVVEALRRVLGFPQVLYLSHLRVNGQNERSGGLANNAYFTALSGL